MTTKIPPQLPATLFPSAATPTATPTGGAGAQPAATAEPQVTNSPAPNLPPTPSNATQSPENVGFSAALKGIGPGNSDKHKVSTYDVMRSQMECAGDVSPLVASVLKLDCSSACVANAKVLGNSIFDGFGAGMSSASAAELKVRNQIASASDPRVEHATKALFADWLRDIG
jgi:hypothetical protein